MQIMQILKGKFMYAIKIFVVIAGALIFMQNFYMPREILKTAVKENKLKSEKYILCQAAVVTGFDWVMIQDEYGKKTYEFCNIIGIVDPYIELNLRYEFFLGRNAFIFYIEEKKIYYSEEMREDILEYVATGWDILYPVKHGDFPNIISSNKYITSKDVNKNAK